MMFAVLLRVLAAAATVWSVTSALATLVALLSLGALLAARRRPARWRE
jgi:hypothetical protein